MKACFALAAVLGGCTLYEYHADDDINTPGDASAGGGPIGRQFFVDRSFGESQNPSCPSFPQEQTSHNVSVVSKTMVLVDSRNARQVTVRTDPAIQGINAPNVMFTIDENWDTSDGVVSPPISYQLFVSDDRFTGTAMTVFQFSSPPTGTTSCAFMWTFDGFSG